MPDPYSIPFKQAEGNGHYSSKQLPDDNADFLVVLGLPTSVGNVTSASPSSLDGQMAAYWGTSGQVIKASTQIGIVNLVDGVVTTKATPAGEIVGTTAIQTLTNKTITGAVLTAPTGLTKADVGLGAVDNTADSTKPVSAPQQTALNLKEDKVNKGAAPGYASLDATGKVPTGQLPAAALGGITYQGTWNALSNTPTMPAATAVNKGWYYVVSFAGTTMVDGVNSWAVGDWLVSNGNTWDKVDNTDAVTSVSGRQGAVVLTKADVGLDQVDNTSDVTKNSAAATLTNKTITGNSNTLSVRLDADVVGNLPPSNLDGGAGASTASFWRGDGHWGTPAGGGDVASPGSSVDGELALYNGVSGTILKRSFGTGLATVLNGVYQTPTVKPAGVVVGTSDAQTLSGKTMADQVCSCNGLTYRPGGMLYWRAQQDQNVGTADTVLGTFTLPAGAMARDGDTLRLMVALAGAPDTTSKTVRIVFGGEVVTSLTSTIGNEVWSYITTITRTSATTQRYCSQLNLLHSGFTGNAVTSAGAVNLANAVTVAVFGQGTASGKVFLNRMMVEFCPRLKAA